LKDEEILERTQRLKEFISTSDHRVILITNEVGWGIVPASKLGRRFRDLQGMVNQIMAEGADEVYLMVSGLPLKIKP
jgi:adenosylcobinamide kinase/adenosylcobinamide-phosphate guanylyltransferase